MVDDVKYKFFNDQKYLLHQGRWIRANVSQIQLSWDVWNLHHSNNPIQKGDGYCIHHINENSLDDNFENLQKLTKTKHHSQHLEGTKNPQYVDGRALKENMKEYQRNYERKNRIEKLLFNMSDKENKFTYRDTLRFNKKTGHIIISHTWGYYESKENNIGKEVNKK